MKHESPVRVGSRRSTFIQRQALSDLAAADFKSKGYADNLAVPAGYIEAAGGVALV